MDAVWRPVSPVRSLELIVAPRCRESGDDVGTREQPRIPHWSSMCRLASSLRRSETLERLSMRRGLRKTRASRRSDCGTTSIRFDRTGPTPRAGRSGGRSPRPRSGSGSCRWCSTASCTTSVAWPRRRRCWISSVAGGSSWRSASATGRSRTPPGPAVSATRRPHHAPARDAGRARRPVARRGCVAHRAHRPAGRGDLGARAPVSHADRHRSGLVATRHPGAQPLRGRAQRLSGAGADRCGPRGVRSLPRRHGRVRPPRLVVGQVAGRSPRPARHARGTWRGPHVRRHRRR